MWNTLEKSSRSEHNETYETYATFTYCRNIGHDCRICLSLLLRIKTKAVGNVAYSEFPLVPFLKFYIHELFVTLLLFSISAKKLNSLPYPKY
jgi:hypothetical protein